MHQVRRKDTEGVSREKGRSRKMENASTKKDVDRDKEERVDKQEVATTRKGFVFIGDLLELRRNRTHREEPHGSKQSGI